jgi:hypothetical protein
MEADSGTQTPHLSDLKRIIRQRIAEIEAAQRSSLPDKGLA